IFGVTEKLVELLLRKVTLDLFASIASHYQHIESTPQKISHSLQPRNALVTLLSIRPASAVISPDATTQTAQTTA
ncbi:hypothetical protein, partial [Halorubrum sp. SD690R]|uniref:hypothetical protein n=1 Tax=Halorubrum sp. SD690R TaxID=2518117 RepID=UPI001A7E4DFB